MPLYRRQCQVGAGAHPELPAAGTAVVAVLALSTFVAWPAHAAMQFTPFIPFETGINPTSVAIGDLDRDGKSDLVVANYGGYAPPYHGSVSVLLGNGDGTFAPKRDFPAGHASTTVAMADLNDDGKLDVVVANYGADGVQTGFVSVLLGKGDGMLQPKIDYQTGGEPYSVAIGDLDGDAKLDLATANWNSNSVSVLLGNGDGTFGRRVDLTTGLVPKSLAIGNLNKDGIPDLAVANLGDTTVSVLLGLGNGAFAPKVDFVTGWSPTTVAISDLDGDGKSDLAATSAADDSVLIFRGNGDGWFEPTNRYETGSIPWLMAIGDLDADGALDIVTANAADNTVSVLIGNGDGSFGTQSRYSTGAEPISVAIGDLNGDAKADLAVACNGYPPGIVAVHLGSADGTFGPKVRDPVGTDFALLSLTPNPSQGDVQVTFSVPREAFARLSVYDVQGRRVAVLAEREFSLGMFDAVFSASSLSPQGRSGVYLVRLDWPGGSTIRKLVMTR